MSVNNSIVKKSQSSSYIITYESNGETIKLSPQMVRDYLVSGGGEVSDQEVVMFLSMCKYQRLNPFLKEAYLIKYGTSPATMVVGKDTFLKRARRHPDFRGLQAGIIVKPIHSDFSGFVEREGANYDKTEEVIVGGWAKVFLKDYQQPFYTSVSMDEYIGKKSNGEVNNQWATKPATMIRKVALAQALREAFPEETLGLYEPEELGIEEPINPKLDTLVNNVEPNVNVSESKEAVNEPLASPSEEDAIASTLFEV